MPSSARILASEVDRRDPHRTDPPSRTTTPCPAGGSRRATASFPSASTSRPVVPGVRRGGRVRAGARRLRRPGARARNPGPEKRTGGSATSPMRERVVRCERRHGLSGRVPAPRSLAAFRPARVRLLDARSTASAAIGEGRLGSGNPAVPARARGMLRPQVVRRYAVQIEAAPNLEPEAEPRGGTVRRSRAATGRQRTRAGQGRSRPSSAPYAGDGGTPPGSGPVNVPRQSGPAHRRAGRNGSGRHSSQSRAGPARSSDSDGSCAAAPAASRGADRGRAGADPAVRGRATCCRGDRRTGG